MKFTRNIKLLFLLSTVTLLVFFSFSYAKADIVSDPIGSLQKPEGSISSVGAGVQTIANALITVGQVAFIVLFLVGGVMYLTSMGNEDQAGKARKLMLEAVIGLIIVMSAWAVSTWVIDHLKNSGDSSDTSTIATPLSLYTK